CPKEKAALILVIRFSAHRRDLKLNCLSVHVLGTLSGRRAPAAQWHVDESPDYFTAFFERWIRYNEVVLRLSLQTRTPRRAQKHIGISETYLYRETVRRRKPNPRRLALSQRHNDASVLEPRRRRRSGKIVNGPNREVAKIGWQGMAVTVIWNPPRALEFEAQADE